MNRQEIVKKLVDRKIAKNEGKAFKLCICLARKICFAGGCPSGRPGRQQ